MWPAKSGQQDAAYSRTWLQTILQSEGMGRSGPRLAVSKETPIPAATDSWTQAMEFPGIACQVRSCLFPPTVSVPAHVQVHTPCLPVSLHSHKDMEPLALPMLTHCHQVRVPLIK